MPVPAQFKRKRRWTGYQCFGGVCEDAAEVWRGDTSVTSRPRLQKEVEEYGVSGLLQDECGAWASFTFALIIYFGLGGSPSLTVGIASLLQNECDHIPRPQCVDALEQAYIRTMGTRVVI